MYTTIESFSQIGKLASTHGLEGHIALVHHLKGKNTIKKLDFIFIELRNGNYIPFKILQFKSVTESDAIIALDGIQSVEQAKQLAGKNIYIPADQYKVLQPEELTMNFKDYILYDQYDKKVGIIIEVTEYPGQLMASVLLPNKQEALIPIVEQHIINIDGRKKELTLQIPDGLIDIYL